MNKKPFRLTLLLPLVFFLVLASVFYVVLKSDNYDPNYVPSALVGEAFPDFELPSLLATSTLTKASIIGKPMLVNVWATWCVSCRIEHPFLNVLKKRGIPIVGINYKDEVPAAKAWLEELGNPYRQIMVDSDGTLGMDLGVYGAPETFFVDANGRIRYKFTGVINEQKWQDELLPIFQAMQE